MLSLWNCLFTLSVIFPYFLQFCQIDLFSYPNHALTVYFLPKICEFLFADHCLKAYWSRTYCLLLLAVYGILNNHLESYKSNGSFFPCCSVFIFSFHCWKKNICYCHRNNLICHEIVWILLLPSLPRINHLSRTHTQF